MPNEKLLATLQETRNEIVQERYTRIDRLQRARDALNEATLRLSRAENDDRLAIQADEDVKEKQRVLVQSINDKPGEPQPQYLVEKIGRLQNDQLANAPKLRARPFRFAR
jgi:hypothetical protein